MNTSNMESMNDNNDNNDHKSRHGQDGQQDQTQNNVPHDSQVNESMSGLDCEFANNGAHMFVDGLLQTHFQTPLVRERRIARVMNAIPEPREIAARTWMKFVRQSGALIASAAVIALMFIIGPREVEASAQAKAVVTAEQKTRDRRVLFQLIPPRDRQDGPDFIGSLDIRDAKHLVMTIRQPDGTIEVRGRDGEHYWMIDRNGKLRDLPSDMPWPAWVQSPRGGLLVDMAEAVEQGLNDEWKWSRADAQLENVASKVGDHLIATRVKNKPMEPNKIDVRFNPVSGLAVQIEMSWPENMQPPRRMDGDGAMNGEGRPMRDGAMNGEGRPMRDGAMNGEGRPMRDGAMNGEGSPNGGPPKGPKQSVPMGPPSKMTLIVEPPITFDAAWFTPEKQLSINGK
ncbi:MAG: hypothetical protein EXS12_08045 [Phycisphaerales bacterium]|nr:hypothetical protein [Phycisphaerales bacterium]